MLRLANQAADAIRELNHLTRHSDAFADPAELAARRLNHPQNGSRKSAFIAL